MVSTMVLLRTFGASASDAGAGGARMCTKGARLDVTCLPKAGLCVAGVWPLALAGTPAATAGAGGCSANGASDAGRAYRLKVNSPILIPTRWGWLEAASEAVAAAGKEPTHPLSTDAAGP